MRPQILKYLSSLSLRIKFLTSFILGSLGAMSQAPVYAFIILPLSFTLFLGLINTSEKVKLKHLFLMGWLFSLGYHVFGLYWITVALSVDLTQFWWLVPFSVFGLPALLALFFALIPILVKRISANPLTQVIVFTALFSLSEWLRGHMLTGFPWNLIGYTWGVSTSMLQITSVIGIYGLTLLTILWASSFYVWFHSNKIKFVLLTNALMVGVFSYGYFRLNTSPTTYTESINLRLVQPNIKQSFKWDADKVKENYATILSLSSKPSSNNTPITHVIWPESAIPFYLEENIWRREEIMSSLPQNAYLLTGGLRREFTEGRLTQIWNSFFVISPQKSILHVYDKFHLVPFGEYVPLRRFIPNVIKKATHGSLDFSSGSGLQTLRSETTPSFSPLICYEGIFPAATVNAQNRPEWIINITNDAWYGNTSGPYQHLGIVQVRAIEEGLPLARVANTGITAMFDAYGRELQRLSLNETGYLDTKLPSFAPPTLYSIYKDKLFFIILTILLGFGCILRFYNREK